MSLNCCWKLNFILCGSKKRKENCIREKEFLNQIDFNLPISSEERNSLQINSSDHSTLNNTIIRKDVIIYRNDRYQPLGLTLSYQLISNSKINIFIEKVDVDSIAHCQGRLQRGDQIIQINHHRIHNRDQAIRLIYQTNIVILQILSSNIDLAINEQDSGINLPSNQYLQTIHQFRDLSSAEDELFNGSIHSQSLFDISTDNEKGILKPLPFITNDQKKIKQEKYRIKPKRKKYWRKSEERKRSKDISLINEDFLLLNRIFLRENQQELLDKPFLANIYQQQSNIEKEKLNQFIQEKEQTTTHLSFNQYSEQIFI